ncbi:MAG TPA: LytTR family DNA-binding domain-containing protein [Candidatus Sulfotelmatobacter sp.]
MMNTLKMGPAEHAVSSAEGAGDFLVDRAPQHARTPLVMARDEGEQPARSMQTFPGVHGLAKPRSLRVAIKVRGKILFINLSDLVSVQAKGKCVWLEQKASSYLLRESISVVAERLESHGFIRIHRSVLVNTSLVEEIRPLSTGEYCLRVEGGKEYTVTRTYKKNLKSIAEFWIGTGAFFPG